MAKKRKVSSTKGMAWPKPDIKGAVKAPQTWFLDSAGDVDMVKKRRRTTNATIDDTADAGGAKKPGSKSREKNGIKGSLHELAKVSKMAKRIQQEGGVKKAQKKAEVEDPWATDLDKDLNRPENDWVAYTGTTKIPQRYKKKAKMAPEKSKVPAVVVAHKGASVKPLEEDRQALEAIATGHELTRLDAKDFAEEAHKGKKTALGRGHMKPEPIMDGEESDEEGDMSHRVVENNKLTRAERNKKKRREELERAAATAKAEKIRLKQMNRHGEMLKELKKEKAQQAKKQKEVEAHREEVALQKPKKLSKHIYEESRPEVKLPGEIPQQLRSLAVEGNLFRDRFQSMQKRNIIEPRQVQKGKRRYKLKVKNYVNDNGTGLNGLEGRTGPRESLAGSGRYRN